MDISQRTIALESQPLESAKETTFPRILFVSCDHTDQSEAQASGSALAKSLEQENWQVGCYEPPRVLPRLLKGSLLGEAVARVIDKSAFVRDLARQISRYQIVHLSAYSIRGISRLALPALVLARFFGKKTVLHFGSAETEQFLERYGGWFHPLLKAADAIVVGSRYLEKVVGRAKLSAIRLTSPVDTEAEQYREVITEQPRVLIDTTLEPSRGVGRAIRAFKLVKQKYPRTEMVVIGTGSLQAALRRSVNVNQLNGIEFAGDVSSEQRAKLYAECDVFLHPATADETPVSLVRAFAAGLPVVATDADGVLHMLRDRINALVVPVGDHVAMANRIIELVEDSDLSKKLSRRGQHELRKYSWSRVRQDWINLYTRLLTAL